MEVFRCSCSDGRSLMEPFRYNSALDVVRFKVLSLGVSPVESLNDVALMETNILSLLLSIALNHGFPNGSTI